MVASRIVDLWKGVFDVVSADERMLDITEEENVKSFFEKQHFDTVINFAAYTNVDGAQKENGDKNGLVWKLNVEGPKYLAKAGKEKNFFLIHISTDFVFPGDSFNPGPYSENSHLPEEPQGIGWYGWTKNRAEKIVSECTLDYAIIRYGYPFRADKYDLKLDWARNLLKLYNEQKLYPLFTDQIQSVVFIDDLADPLAKIVNEHIGGIFHLASYDTTTPFDAGEYLLSKYSGRNVSLQKGSMEDFLEGPGRTPRPRLGGLKVEATESKLGVSFNTWKEMIDEFLGQLRS